MIINKTKFCFGSKGMEFCMFAEAFWSFSIFLAGFLALCALLPWHVFRHVMVSVLLGLMLLMLWIPPVHVTDRDIFYPLGQILLLIILACISLPIAMRAIWAGIRGEFDLTLHTHLDKAMACASGAVFALFCFVPLSVKLADTSVLPAHVTAAVIALAVGFIAHPFARSFGVFFAALTLYSLYYPSIVEHAAAEAAQTEYRIKSHDSPDTPDLTFLSMPKFPHPQLHFDRDGTSVALGWSYRRRAFLPILH